MYHCQTPSCAIAISKAEFPVEMNCPVCQTHLSEIIKLNESIISIQDNELLQKLPYVIAYPLKETLLQNDYEKRLHRFGYTFINFLKYLGLISISEFFNSDLKNRRIVDLFLSQLGEPSFGKWNAFIRESYAILKKEDVNLVFPEFYNFYIQIENKDKKFNISEEIIEDFGEINYSKKNGISSIGMLINFRNKYLGHGTPINENQARELWEQYYPIFQNLLLKFSKFSEASLYKKENGIIWKLASTEITEEKAFHTSIDETRVWLTDNKERKLSMVPFLIIPSDFGDLTNESHLYVYESYTGKTLKFFSPESIVKETSGEILQRLNILLRDKQKETPFSPALFTKEAFLERISEENNLVFETLVNEKKVIPGVYQHREPIEIKLREWMGVRANIFFIAAEAGSGKTNLLVEIQKQYTERQLPSLLIRAARMEKKTLKAEIAYQLNVDESISLEKYTAIAGTQAEPTFFLLDGLNEAENAEAIWREIIEMSAFFEPGSVKFVITNRVNGKDELERYIVSDEEQNLLYGENKDNEKGLGAYTFWLTTLDMNEMKAAWESYAIIDKSKFKPNFTFDALASFDRGLYNKIDNPLILRLFLEVYNGKSLPKKGGNHLNIWKDWFASFTKEEQTFMRLLAHEIWQKGKNELLFDDVIKSDKLKDYFENDISKFPYDKLKKNGWISRYSKGLDSFIGFTVEGLLLYLLGIQLDQQEPKIDITFIDEIGENGTKLQKSAIRSYLKELAIKGELDLITALIDKGNDLIGICIEPIFIYLKTFGVQETITQLLANPTVNDWKALFKLDARLGNLQLHLLRKDFLKEIMPYNQLQTKDEVWLGLKAITLFDNEESLKYLLKIDTTKDFIQEDEDILFQLGRLEDNFGNYDKALEYYEKSLAIRLKTLDSEHPSVATSYNNIGLVWKLKGEYDKALEYYEKSLAIRLKTFGENHAAVATSYNNIGGIWDSRGEYDKALDYYKKSLEIRLITFGGEHPSVATSYSNIGLLWNSKGEYDKALDYYEKSLEIKFKTLGGEHPSVATSYNNIGLLWDSKGEYDKALDYYEKSLEINLKTVGGEHPKVATSYSNIGVIWKTKGNYDKALEFYEKCLSIELKTFGENHVAVATSYNDIGGIWDSKGNYDKALEYCEKSLAIRLKTFGENHVAVATSYNNIGGIWDSKGNYDKALEFYEKSLAIILKILGSEHPKVASSYNNIGLVWDSKGNYDKALEFYEKSLAIILKILGSEHPKVATSYNNIGNIWKKKGNYDKAIENFKIGYGILIKGGFPYKIAQCYEALNEKENALDFYIQSAEIRKEDPNCGLEAESTKESINNAKRLAKQLDIENELPEWIIK